MTREEQARHRLDNWKLWVGIAYFGLSAVVVALFFINQNTQGAVAHQARDEATHHAEIVANATSQYHQCLTSIPVFGQINNFIDGVREVEETLVVNSAAVVASTPRMDPEYKTRVENLQRLRDSSAAAAHVKFPVPTTDSCKTLEAKLLKEN